MKVLGAQGIPNNGRTGYLNDLEFDHIFSGIGENPSCFQHHEVQNAHLTQNSVGYQVKAV